MGDCVIQDCSKPAKARGWCAMHWYRWRYNGDPSVVQVRVRAQAGCSVPECDTPAWARGLCGTHLSRLRKTGTTEAPERKSADSRFWDKVDQDGPLPDYRPELGPCWLWLGGKTDLGYGQFFPTRRNLVGAHRYSYSLAAGPIPDGLHLDHLCRVPSCVNPNHLEPVTVRENTIRGNRARAEMAVAS